MASITLDRIADRFPAGTTVGAYLPSLTPGESPIVGAAIDESVVQLDGSLAFEDLEPGTWYVAWDGTRGVRFRTDTTPEVEPDITVQAPRAELDEPDGDLVLTAPTQWGVDHDDDFVVNPDGLTVGQDGVVAVALVGLDRDGDYTLTRIGA